MEKRVFALCKNQWYTILSKRISFYPNRFYLEFWILSTFLWQDCNGQEVSVVLLDTEGTDSAQGTGFDDHQIFTLTVLVSSVLIYNSSAVANRRDLDELEYLLNHSPQRIAEGTVVYSDPKAFCKVYLAFEFITFSDKLNQFPSIYLVTYCSVNAQPKFLTRKSTTRTKRKLKPSLIS